jgi:hypothetical protein
LRQVASRLEVVSKPSIGPKNQGGSRNSYPFPRKAKNSQAEIIANFDNIFKKSCNKFSRKMADASEFFMENCKYRFVTLARRCKFPVSQISCYSRIISLLFGRAFKALAII